MTSFSDIQLDKKTQKEYKSRKNRTGFFLLFKLNMLSYITFLWWSLWSFLIWAILILWFFYQSAKTNNKPTTTKNPLQNASGKEGNESLFLIPTFWFQIFFHTSNSLWLWINLIIGLEVRKKRTRIQGRERRQLTEIREIIILSPPQ